MVVKHTEERRSEWDLADTTQVLGYNYEHWKVYGAEKDLDKDRFFELANEALRDDLAEKVTTMKWYDDESEEDVVDRLMRHNPGWTLDVWRWAEDESVIEAIIIEDVNYKPYTFVNKDQGRVYARTASKGSPNLDEDYLKKDNPEFYETLVYTLPWGEEVLPPLNTMTAAQMGKLQKYIYRGKPSAKLAPPRDAKPEELADA